MQGIEQVKDPAKFLHLVADEICNPPKKLQQDEISILKDAYKTLFKKLLNEDPLKKETVSEALKLEKVNTSFHDVIFEVLSARAEDLRQALRERTSNMSQAYLKDFDWKTHLVVSSDKLSTMRDPVLLLNLLIHQNEQQGSEKEVVLELTRDELQCLISTLDKINETVQELKV